jgi:Icc protein
MADHLRRAADEVLAMDARPAGVIVNGDCARTSGRRSDYRAFRDLLIDPLARHDLPLYLTLGNHDSRDRFLGALGDDVIDAPVDGRVVSVVRGRHANFFLLDTLDRTGRVSGKVGRQQLAWLDGALTALDDAPAIVFGHHPRGGDEVDLLRRLGSLRDGRDLWGVLSRHPNVKAYVYGHTHRWDVTQRDGIYLINLPATSFAFDPKQPTGWVGMTLRPTGAKLKFNRLGGGAVTPGGSSVTLRWTARPVVAAAPRIVA